MGEQYKACGVCGKVKPIEEFHRRKFHLKDGSVTYGAKHNCKLCANKERQAWDQSHRERRREYSLRMHRKKKFGISDKTINDMLEAQGRRCAICGQTSKHRELDIDHCHSSNTVRSLLCSNCNIGLGRFKDNPELLRRAAAYIEGHRERVILGTMLDKHVKNRFELVM